MGNNQVIELRRGSSHWIEKNQHIMATLTWEGREEDHSGDLDFYCFYITKQMEKCGKIYYKNQGSFSKPPYISLQGDSEVAGTETLLINDNPDLEYVLLAIYSAAENGKGNFSTYKPTVTIRNDDITASIILENTNKNSYWVAVALLDFTGSNIKINACETYAGPSLERSPILYKNGTFKMNAGDIEFKAFDLHFNQES